MEQNQKKKENGKEQITHGEARGGGGREERMGSVAVISGETRRGGREGLIETQNNRG